MPRRQLLVPLALALLAGAPSALPAASAGRAASADTLRLHEDVFALASEDCAGRRAGTPGNARAREYLLSRLASLGLEPLPGADGLTQPFAVVGVELDSLRGALGTPAGAQVPLQLSVASPFRASASPRVVAWPKGEPAPACGAPTLLIRLGPAGRGEEFSPSSLELEAEAAGAEGVVLVPDPADSTGLFGHYLARTRSRDPRLYALAGAPPTGVLAYADGPGAELLYGMALSTPEGWGLRLPAGRPLALEGVNLVGRLPGEEPSTRVLLLSAHYDHLGVTPEGLFPGADDNVSGVATLLETLELLHGQPHRDELRVLLADGEELGLLGARAYLAAEGKPDRVINLDSVGRAGVDSYRKLRDPSLADARLMIHWSSDAGAPGATRLDAALAARGFAVQAGDGPMFARGGDHWVFAEAGVPADFLFGGFHVDYNTVNDRPERLLLDRLGLLAEALASYCDESLDR
ncbi:MAG: M28 family peptidase [Candidatus Latescibacteria bacterium]|nr:M28 family peptidase [Candidatus Latescibacterota bacterium]